MRRTVLLVMISCMGCGLDQEFVQHQRIERHDTEMESVGDEVSDTGDVDEPNNSESDDAFEEYDDDTDAEYDTGSWDTDEETVEPETAREPTLGEIVITELMINPEATADSDGEYVELTNTSSATLDLSGHVLSDDGVDEIEIVPVAEGSLEVGPGDAIVICANDDQSLNGGIHCSGTFYYQTFGGGFALSNTEDEVILSDPDGTLIDVLAYVEGETPVGASMGLGPNHTDASENDDFFWWCSQTSEMNSGDAGTPGFSNDSCSD